MHFRFLSKVFLLTAVFFLSAFSIVAQNPVSLSMSLSPGSVPSGGRGTVRITASISGGWKMYSITQGAGGPIPTRITFADGAIKAGAVSGPRPKVAMDPNFNMNTETYSGSAVFSAPFTVDQATPIGEQTLNATVRYMACTDTVCLPPRNIKLSATVNVLAASAKPEATPSPTPKITPTPTPTPDNANVNTNTNANSDVNSLTVANVETNTENQSTTSNSNDNSSPSAISLSTGADITHQPIWGFIWLAMTFGALSLLTPCVFPMIPITVSYFTKHGSETTAGSIKDALIYAFGIILTFTGLGVALAILFGAAGINRFAANPYTNLLITAIFLLFAFSLLGAYNLGVPSSILTKLDGMARSQNVGKTVALLLMGLTFSLTSFTCTVPLVGVILVAAAQGELIYPIIGMLAFSSVFALPFFVLALAPRLMQSLPRAGSWMNSVKVVMGFLEIGAALKFLSNVDLVWGWNIFTREVVISGWIALSLLTFLYLLGVFRFSHDSENTRIGLVRVLNAFLFGTLTFYLITGLFGNRLGELESFLPPAKQTASVNGGGSSFNNELSWLTNDYQAAVAQAKAENKKIFLDFTGYTCTNCRWMEANMFPQPAVTAELEKFVRVKLFTDGEGEPYEGFQRMQEERYGTIALPLYVILNPDESPVAKFEGLTRNPDEFINFLKK